MSDQYRPISIPNIGKEAVVRALRESQATTDTSMFNERETLIDMYEGCQTDKDQYLKSFFNKETDTMKAPDYPHNLFLTYSNITQKLINEKCKLYKSQPLRQVNGVEAEKYEEMLEDAFVSTTSKMCDRYNYLLGVIVLAVNPSSSEKKIVFDIITNNYKLFVLEKDPFRPVGILYRTMSQDKDGSEIWQYADSEKYIQFNSLWNVLKEEDNPVKYFNYIYVPSTKPIRSLYTKDAADIVNANQAINVILTSINNALRLQGFPQMVVTGLTEEEAKNIKTGFDRAITISGATSGTTPADVKYITSEADFEQLFEMIKQQFSLIASIHNLQIEYLITGNIASGIQLRILKISDLEDRQDRIDLFKEYFERPLYEICKAIGQNVDGFEKIEEGDLSVDFNDIEFPKEAAEDQAQWEFDLKTGAKSLIDYLKWLNPDLSDEDAEKQLDTNFQINKRLTQKFGINLQSLLEKKTEEKKKEVAK